MGQYFLYFSDYLFGIINLLTYLTDCTCSQPWCVFCVCIRYATTVGDITVCKDTFSTYWHAFSRSLRQVIYIYENNSLLPITQLITVLKAQLSKTASARLCIRSSSGCCAGCGNPERGTKSENRCFLCPINLSRVSYQSNFSDLSLLLLLLSPFEGFEYNTCLEGASILE